MAKLKTAQNDGNVHAFLSAVENDSRRRDAFELLDIMKDLTGLEPKLWGPSIVGFGSYHYKYDSGREGQWFLAGFSPRKQNMTIYIMPGFDRYTDLMERLGKHKTGKSCLYVNSLSDVNVEVLKELISEGFNHMNNKYNLS